MLRHIILSALSYTLRYVGLARGTLPRKPTLAFSSAFDVTNVSMILRIDYY